MNEHEQASRLKAIIDTAIDGIITIDTEGTIESINPAAARLFDYQADEVIGKNICILMPEPYQQQHDGYMSRYLQTGEKRIIGIGREVAGKRKDGTVFPFRLAISEVRMVEGVHIFTGIIHDLSREKQAEEQLRHYAAELERSNKELENFAYVSSHDLQEPLRKIQAFGSRLQEREQETLGDQSKDYLNRMLNAAQRMQTLINDLLTFSRVSTRVQPFIQVDLNRIVKEVLSDLEISIREANATIEASPLPSLPADPTQMRQLFQNLISNAIKFRKDEQAPLIEIYQVLRPGTVAGIDPIEIHVRDNGIGFDEKYLDRIFDIFQRLEGQKYPGSGVGLSICRRIVTRHGGSLTAQSQPGLGTTFIITLSAQNPPESGS